MTGKRTIECSYVIFGQSCNYGFFLSTADLCTCVLIVKVTAVIVCVVHKCMLSWFNDMINELYILEVL